MEITLRIVKTNQLFILQEKHFFVGWLPIYSSSTEKEINVFIDNFLYFYRNNIDSTCTIRVER